MTHTTTDAAEARVREMLARAMASKYWGGLVREGKDGNWHVIRPSEAIAAMLAFATAEAASGAGEREWPNIGEDPMKARPYDDRMAVSAAALRKAYTVQQPIVPDQTALVWRWHLGALLEAEIRLRAITSRDDAASLPPATAPAMVTVKREAIEELTVAGYVMEWRGGYRVVWQGKERREFFDDRDAAYESLARVRAEAILAALATTPTIPATGEQSA